LGVPQQGSPGQQAQSPQEALLNCEAFTAADELATYYKRCDNGEAQDVATTAKHGDKAATQGCPVAEPIPAVCTATQNAVAAVDSAETCTQAPPAITPIKLAEGYLPLTAAAFEQIQSKLTVPCTVDAYAVKESALCAQFVEPGDDLLGVGGNTPPVYWYNLPTQIQHGYMQAYKAHKASNPQVGSCWLVPQRTSSYMTQMLKSMGMHLLTTFGRNTPMFTDLSTAKTVRSKCTLNVWYDPPSQPSQVSEPSQSAATVCTTVEQAQASTKPRMEVEASINRNHAVILLDTGAADQNYLSADYCKLHGIKTKPLAQPFTAVGVQGSGQITHYCEVFVRMQTYSRKVEFKVMPLPKEASFAAILGDTWLMDNKAVLDYVHMHCVLMTAHKKHIVPAASDLTMPTAGTANSPSASIIGYAATKRFMQHPEAAFTSYW
jgi:hypothetical protein